MKWILGTLALLLAGLVLKLSLLVYAMYVLLAVLLLNRYLARVWMDHLVATRFTTESTLEIGETATVRVEVENTGNQSIPWLLLEDVLPQQALTETPRRMKANGARIKLARLKARAAVTLEYQVTVLMRGYYQLGPMMLETGDVFGLNRKFRVVADPHFVLVMPKVLPLQGYNLASRRPIGKVRIAHRLFEDPTRLATIRPYQEGDPLNRIHWRATARTGELHSRVYENSRVAGATFLLDFHEESYRGHGSAACAELAVMSVAALANAVYLMGEQIGLVSNGRDAADRIREEGWSIDVRTRRAAHEYAKQKTPNERLRPVIIETRKGEDQFPQILQTLARLEHTDGLTFPEMLSEAGARMRRDATLVPVLRRVTPRSPWPSAVGPARIRRDRHYSFLEEWTTPDWAQPPDWPKCCWRKESISES
jgi:uncharacterized protein (DUF58 family)